MVNLSKPRTSIYTYLDQSIYQSIKSISGNHQSEKKKKRERESPPPPKKKRKKKKGLTPTTIRKKKIAAEKCHLQPLSHRTTTTSLIRSSSVTSIAPTATPSSRYHQILLLSIFFFFSVNSSEFNFNCDVYNSGERAVHELVQDCDGAMRPLLQPPLRHRQHARLDPPCCQSAPSLPLFLLPSESSGT